MPLPTALFLLLFATAAHAAISVRDFGARGDGLTDDTAAINSAIEAGAAAGELVNIPAGDYRIDPLTGVKLKSRSRLVLAPRAILRAIATESGHSRLLQIYDCEDVTISGGQLIGERLDHLGDVGEWGMGADLRKSRNVTIRNIRVSECWGDGIYLSDCSGVSLVDVVCSHNRRQGLSIVGGSEITVRGSLFEKTEGTLPASGIAIEPNELQTVRNVRIANCRCLNNTGRGISISVPFRLTGSAVVDDVQVDGCEVSGNGCEVPAFGIEVSNCSRVKIRNCRLTDNRGIGIGSIKTRLTTVASCLITGTILTENPSDAGVLFSEDTGSELHGCRIVENETPGIFLHASNVNARLNVIARNRARKVGSLESGVGSQKATLLQAVSLPAPDSRPPTPDSLISVPCELVEVYDGDTVTVRVSLDMRIRLIDCWAAEVHTRDAAAKARGLAARDHLRELVPVGSKCQLSVPLTGDRFDDVISLGRVLGRVSFNGQDLSELQVQSGHATRGK